MRCFPQLCKTHIYKREAENRESFREEFLQHVCESQDLCFLYVPTPDIQYLPKLLVYAHAQAM